MKEGRVVGQTGCKATGSPRKASEDPYSEVKFGRKVYKDSLTGQVLTFNKKIATGNFTTTKRFVIAR